MICWYVHDFYFSTFVPFLLLFVLIEVCFCKPCNITLDCEYVQSTTELLLIWLIKCRFYIYIYTKLVCCFLLFGLLFHDRDRSEDLLPCYKLKSEWLNHLIISWNDYLLVTLGTWLYIHYSALVGQRALQVESYSWETSWNGRTLGDDNAEKGSAGLPLICSWIELFESAEFFLKDGIKVAMLYSGDSLEMIIPQWHWRRECILIFESWNREVSEAVRLYLAGILKWQNSQW